MKQLYLKTVLLFVAIGFNGVLQAQVINSVTPSSAHISETITVNISGQGNNFGQGTSTLQAILVLGNDYIAATQLQILDANHLNADFTFDYTNQPGIYDFYVTDSQGNFASMFSAFTLNAATAPFTITGITPNSAHTGQVINVSISGQGASFGQGTSTTNASLNNGANQVSADIVTVVNINTINAQFTLSNNTTTAGIYDVNVFNTIDGPALLPSSFTVTANPNPPSLTSVSPGNANSGSTISVSISGQGSHFGQGTATTQVWFNQGSSTVYSSSVTVNSATSLSADFNIPNGIPLGTYTTNVSENVDGHLNLTNSFIINANPNPPVITSVTPNSGALGTSIPVSISGQNTHFSQGTGTIAFSQGSSTLYGSITNVISSTQLDAMVYIPPFVAIGSYDVMVGNTLDGNMILGNGFTVTTPPCGSIDVYVTQQACANSPAIVSINGGIAPYTLVIDGLTYTSFSNIYYYNAPVTGTYTISSVSDNYGCVATLHDSLIVNNTFTAAVSSPLTVCEGAQVTFVNNINSGSGIVSVTYYYGDGNAGSASSYLYSPGTYNPSMVVTNADGCTLYVPFSNPIVVSPSPQMSILSNNGASCGLNNGAFSVTGTGGQGNFYVYAISGPSSYSSTSATNTNLEAGLYSVSIVDANGCSSINPLIISSVSQITSITGFVSASGGIPVSNATVMLLSADDTIGAMNVSASAITDASGNYALSNLAEGNYILVAVPDSTLNPGSMNTYYSGQALWSLADTIHVTCTSQEVINVPLIDIISGNGNSSISGTITTFTVFRDMIGDAVAGAEVLLYNNTTNSYSGIASTDASGSYSFIQLNPASYTVYADIPGLDLLANYSITLGAGQSVTGTNFYADTLNHFIDTIGFVVTGTKQIAGFANEAIVFPNPFSGQTKLSYTLHTNSTVKAEVYNMTGGLVHTLENTVKTAGTYTTTIRLTNKGMYLVKLMVNDTQKVFKVICTQ